MKIKNTILLARRNITVKKHGQAMWDQLVKELLPRFPILGEPLLATGATPVEDFLAINAEILRRCFGDDSPRVYRDVARQAADWQLTNGPYKGWLNSDLKGFVNYLPTIWDTFYVQTKSHVTISLDANIVHIRILDIGLWHPHFEFGPMAWFQRALELKSGKPVSPVVVKGGPTAVNEIYYTMHM